ncbi:MAG: right-handed parallel beta-helix repeat-containing protein, partial [Ignavibacteriaceae bacterium]
MYFPHFNSIFFNRSQFANTPYLIDGEIKIPYGKKLIIEPGVKVIFTGHYKLIVNGILKALGTEQDSIYFFPSDTSVGWHGIRFIEAEDLSTLEFCVLMYGKTSTPEELKMLEEIPCRQGEECAEWLDPSGGAILINKSHTKINHCLIANNFAARNGGGIYIKNYANPVIRYCHIINNKSFDGGGISSSRISNPFIYHCKIEHNYAENMGGGFLIDLYSNPVIDECSIKENIADSRGGGICFYTSAKPVVKNSTISYNTSALGGGIYIDEFYNKYREQFDKIDIRIINVRIENNTADYGGGIWLRDSQGELSGVTVCYN